MSVSEADATMTPAELVVVSTAPELASAELHKSPEHMHVSTSAKVVHPSAKPVAPQVLVTKIL